MSGAKKKRSKGIGVRLDHVLTAVNEREPGLYEVTELMDGYWRRVPKRGRSRYGAIFKSIAQLGSIPGLRWVGEKGNGHQLYEVLPEKGLRCAIRRGTQC